MTRKDYQLIADVLRNSDLPGNIRSQLTMNFAAALQRDNARFKPTRFCQATRPEIADSEAIKASNAKGFIRATRAWAVEDADLAPHID